MINQDNTTDAKEFQKLLSDQNLTKIPKEGESVKGTVISKSKSEVRVDIEGFKAGIIRGPELGDFRSLYPNLKIGDQVEATVIDLENENGEVELSFRFMGERRVWEDLEKLKRENQTVAVKILDANRGGLMASAGHQMTGFIPVSQLSPEHYPRVSGGDKTKILEKLREYVGKEFNVKVLDVSERDKKLIFSEKVLWEEDQKELLTKYKMGDTIEGKVTALADFGAFISFDGLEGLAHISEIAWQRLDHPADVLKIGDDVKAKVIGLEGSKIFLSIRQLLADPWQNINERYQIGQIVKGKILKVNPFGLFVELDPEIHGLAHVSELEVGAGENLEEKIKPGDELELRIVSLEPTSHRLGLSQKALKDKKTEEKPKEQADGTPEAGELKAEEQKPEVPATEVPAAQTPEPPTNQSA